MLQNERQIKGPGNNERVRTKKAGKVKYLSLCLLLALGLSFFLTPLLAEQAYLIHAGGGQEILSGKTGLLQAVYSLKKAFTGSKYIVFVEDKEALGYRFVENQETDFLNEVYFPDLMGRVVIPSIGTHSVLYDEAENFLRLLDWGSGMVPISYGDSDRYLDSIYIHRVLTKTSGSLYLDEMQVGDPFYVDNYLNGKRFIYRATEVELVEEGEYMERHPYYLGQYNYERMTGDKMLLVTCAPYIYGVSAYRILVAGDLVQEVDIPADDPLYLRYRADHPEDFEG